MAEKTARPKSAKTTEQDPFRKYEEWFVASPDPWVEIAKLEPGSDRTFASTVRAMVTNAEPAQRPGMEDRLLKTLALPELTAEGRMFVCRMLALIGTAKSVPALTALLGDAKTAEAARYALDGLEDPAVDAAYRAALGRLTGEAKAGLIGAIALRGDRSAVPALRAIAQAANEPAAVKAVARRAVERLEVKT